MTLRHYIILLQITVICGVLAIIGYRVFIQVPVTGSLPKNFAQHQLGSIYSTYFEPQASTTMDNSPAWADKPSRNTINQDSLNDRFDYPVEKPDDVFRIAVLGDSFAYGLYVDTNKNFAELLEQKLATEAQCTKKVEILNFGVPAYDIEFAAERFRLRAAKYHPDTVLWFTEAGDFQQVNDIFQPLLRKHAAAAAPGVPFDFFNMPGDVLNTIWPLAREEAKALMTPDQMLEREMAALKKFRQDFDGALILFSIPPAMQGNSVRKELTGFAQNATNTTVILDAVSPWDVTYQVLPDDPHPNALGSRMIADALAEKMIAAHLVPCTK